jgi:hypothetical protein
MKSIVYSDRNLNELRINRNEENQIVLTICDEHKQWEFSVELNSEDLDYLITDLQQLKSITEK